MHPADKGGPEAEVAQAGQCIGHRSARPLNALLHRGIEQLAPLTLHQLHDALLDAHHLQKAVVAF